MNTHPHIENGFICVEEFHIPELTQSIVFNETPTVHSPSSEQEAGSPISGGAEIRRKRVLQSLRKERSQFSMQQILCIALLNEFYNIKLASPFKISKVSDQYMRVKCVELNGEGIDIGFFIKSRVKEMYDDDIKKGVQRKTALRRVQNNRKIDEIHFYQDLLANNGYYFDCSESSGKAGTYKLNSVKRVWKNNSLLLNEQTLPTFCDEVRSYFLSLIEESKKEAFYLKPNDPNISKILSKYL